MVTTCEPSTSIAKTSAKSSKMIRPDSSVSAIGSPVSTGNVPERIVRVGTGVAVDDGLGVGAGAAQATSRQASAAAADTRRRCTISVQRPPAIGSIRHPDYAA